MSVRTRLILSFILILILPSLVIGIISYKKAQSIVKEQMLQNTEQNVQFLNEKVSQLINDRQKEVDFLSQNINSGRYQSTALLPLFTELDQYKKLNPDLLSVYVGTTSGLTVKSPNDPLPSGYDPRKRPWYQQAMAQKGNVIITPPYIDSFTGQVVVTIAKTTRDQSGVVAIDLNLADLAKSASQIKIGNAGYASVIDQNQKIIVHPQKKPGTDATENWMKSLFNSNSGQFEYEDSGQQKEAIFVTNSLTGWKITGTLYTQEFSDVSKPIFITMFIVIAIALLFGLLLAYYIIRSITRPLQQLIQTSRKIENGDLSIPDVSIQNKDEIGELAQSFNHMKQNLRALLHKIYISSEHVTASTEQLYTNSEQSAGVTNQVVTSIQSISEAANHQMNSMKENQRAMEESAVGLQRIAESATAVSESSVEVLTGAKQGNEIIDTTIRKMESINHSVQQSAIVVRELGENSRKIGDIVEVINNIANQTNLLALNAAIEAARAGENGKGFAVVADEVRKLAEQSKLSSEQIAALIQEIQTRTDQAVGVMENGTKEVESGAMIVQQAGEVFHTILSAIQQVTEQVQEVSAATEQISAGTEQLTASVEQLTHIATDISVNTQEVATASQEQLVSIEGITASADSLGKLAQELQNEVKRFTL